MQSSLYIDPVSGGYLVVDNVLQSVNPVINKVNVLLSMAPKSYLYAPNNGNPLLSKKTSGLFTRTEIVNGFNTALAPLLQSKEITSIEVLNINLEVLNKYSVNLKVNFPNGASQELTWERKK